MSLTVDALVERHGDVAVLATSFAQRRFWILDQLEGGASAYTIPQAIRLRGTLDVGALRAAFEDVVARHEVLRTVFAVEGDEPMQVVLPPAPFALPVEAIGGDAAARERQVLARAEANANATFDLGAGPLLRASLLALDAQEHVLLLAVHHIVFDGLSWGVLFAELEAAYAARRAGRPAALAPLAIQYADYAVWQRAQAERPAFQAQLAHWRDALRDPPVLDLPTDRARPAMLAAAGGKRARTLDADAVAGLAALARAQGATPYMAHLAAWVTLLHRWSGQDDVVVGSITAGRKRPELEPLVGLFLNTLAVRVDASGAPSFTELLGRVRARALDAYANDDVPFEQVVDAVQPARDPSRTPIFQVAFQYLEGAARELRLDGLATARVSGTKDTAKFDLTLNVLPAASGGAQALVEYRGALWDGATVDRLLAHYDRLLQAIVADPSCPIGALPMLPAEERALVLERWNDTAVPMPAGETLVSLLADQAARTPSAPAVEDEARRLTYAELDAASTALARRLRAAGAGAGTRVGIAAPRSAELVVALLAAVKAGAAYVPVDPEYPADRIAFMLDDADVRVLLTTREVEAALPPHRAPVLHLDGVAMPVTPVPPMDWPLPSSDAPAYMIYTSGSTGRPKGALNAHRGIVNRLRWMQSEYQLSARDTVLQKTPFSFDVSVWEFFWPLITGARLVMARPGGHRDPAYLAEAITTATVTVCHFVPSMLRAFLADDASATCTTLRDVMVSGEALPPDLVAGFYQRLPRARLHNLYGPTECAVDVSYFACPPSPDAPAVVPIGRPVANTRLYVLDALGQPCPVGVPGELFLAGAQVGLGYHNRPELTAERFVPDPFAPASAPDARMYRTGDRARWLPDGMVEYLGRLDFQVKLRGHRIELGEIEAALAAHAQVAEAVVVVREDVPGDARLVAYVVARGEAPTAATLRAHLGARLPEFMVPSAIVTLEALPVSANGKLDRRALPRPGLAGASDAPYVAPRTATETRVAETWAAVLGRDRVGVADDFFALGGHSMLAMRVVARLSAWSGVRLTIGTMFEARTVAALAERLDAMVRAREGGSAPSHAGVLPRGERAGESRLSLDQEVLWLHAEMHPESNAYNLLASRRVHGALDPAILAAALRDVVARHEALRTAIQATAAGPRARVLDADATPIACVDLRAADAVTDAQVHAACAAAQRAPFRLSEGTTPRLVLVQLPGDESVLALVAPHVVMDARSVSLVLADLGAAYAARARGAAPGFAPAAQMGDYADWQLAQVTPERMGTLRDFWTRELDGAAAHVPFVAEGAVGATGTARVAVPLPDDASRALDALARAHGGTPFAVLLGLVQLVLARLTEERDVVVGVPVSGRTIEGSDEVVGYLTRSVPVRATPADAADVATYLATVQGALTRALDHADAPIEQVLTGEGASGAVNVLVNRPDVVGATDRFATFAMAPFAIPGGDAKFDLEVSLVERHGARTLRLQYREGLWTPEGARLLATRVVIALREAAADATRAPLALPLMDADEARRVRTTWNATDVPLPTETVISRFEAQVRATPAAVAAEDAHERLTYAELERRTARLAGRLLDAGVVRGARVGIAVERSVDLLVAIVGVLRAGAAYVPLDAEYPGERLRFMVEDAELAALVHDTAFAERHPTLLPLVRELVEVHAASASPGEARTLPPVSPDDVAYMIYTSGSTGLPKGALNGHRALLNRLAWMQDAYRLGERDVVLQKTPASFDVSVWEFLWPLVTGARCSLAPAGAHREPAALAACLAERGVTVCHFVPAMLREFLVAGVLPALPALRDVMASGEALPPELVASFARALPQARLHNLYGPTECAVDVTAWTCPTDPPPAVVPIGRPVANTRLYVQDADGQLAPIGMPGELLIGGVQVGLGYHRRPELTRQRFIADPYGPDATGRVYRTGDRARWRPDGTVEYLGRLDFQVKLRGVRIELGEIEALLREDATVSDAVAIVRGDPSTDGVIVGYVVPRAGASPDGAALRRALQGRLPAAAVPTSIVVLDAFPLSPSGKLDRRALPAPVVGAAHAGAAPRTDVERVVAHVWREVLGTDVTDVDASFTELGGHSLLATRVAAQLARIFRAQLTLRLFFEAPTVSGLARALVALEAKPGQATLIAATFRKVQQMTPEERERLRRPAPPVAASTGTAP